MKAKRLRSSLQQGVAPAPRAIGTKRSRTTLRLLEALEGRVMLTAVVTYTWVGRDSNNLWSDPQNWNDETGTQAVLAPNNTPDQWYNVILPTTTIIYVDQNVDLYGLTVQGAGPSRNGRDPRLPFRGHESLPP